MIAWLNPVALAGLIAVAAPILVHLLLRQRAVRTVVPTVRFVPRAVPQSARLRRPSDPWLLLVRVGIVACAALAMARPLFVTEARRAGWNERIARAVIVDAGDGARPELADLLRAELGNADPARQEETRDLGGALRRAVSWLHQSPPARREIVLVSSFVHGALTQADVDGIPDAIGLRFVRVPRRAPPERLRGRVITIDGAREFEARLDGDSTIVRYGPAVPANQEGLVILARPEDAEAVARLRRVLARAGAADASATRPTVVRFRGGPPLGPGGPGDPDATGAALRLVQDPAMAGQPIVATASASELRVDAGVDAASLEAVTIVRAALDARPDPKRVAAHEVVLVADAALSAWSRAPSAPSGESWRQEDRSDARWFWIIALVLLAAEGLMRRRQERPLAEVTADAA